MNSDAVADFDDIIEKIQRGGYDVPGSLYDKDRNAYRRAQSDAREEFRKDLIKVCGLQGHPKEQKFWDYVWQKGHSSGYWEIVSVAQDVIDLMVDMKTIQDAELWRGLPRRIKEDHIGKKL